MILRITECEGSQGGRDLLRDLADYPSVDKLARAILDRKSAFFPHDFGIAFGGKGYFLRLGAQDTPDAEAILKRISGKKSIPNDDIAIKADIFEKELFIDLDRSDPKMQ